MLRPILRQGIGLLSSRRATGKLLVLTYHRVLETYDAIINEIDAVQFTQQMETLAEYFNVISLAEGVERLQAGTLAAGSVCITFDDGYRDNVDVALPILDALDLPATFFVATGYLGNGIMWNDVIIESMRKTSLQQLDLREFDFGIQAINTESQRIQVVDMLLGKWKYKTVKERDQLARRLQELAEVKLDQRIMMTEQEVKELSNAGMEIGGHTINHPILAVTELSEAIKQIRDCKRELETIINKPVRFFAYPNGRIGKDYLNEHLTAVKEAGYLAALTTNDGYISHDADLYELPRVSVNHTSKFKFGASLARGYVQYGS